jgi:hypothetical protein
MGAMRELDPLGGGVKGGGSPNGCGGGTDVDVGESVAGCVFESASKDLVTTPDRFFLSTKGDRGGDANPGSLSDGCMNGFAVVGGL